MRPALPSTPADFTTPSTFDTVFVVLCIALFYSQPIPTRSLLKVVSLQTILSQPILSFFHLTLNSHLVVTTYIVHGKRSPRTLSAY
jgi:Na+/H+ antiporter NhaA